MGDGGGRCECLPCPFPFLRLQQSLPSRRCALCLPYKGLSAGKPLPVLPCVAWPHCINAGGLGGLSFLLQPPGIHLHITVVVLSTHAGAEALLHGLRTDISAAAFGLMLFHLVSLQCVLGEGSIFLEWAGEVWMCLGVHPSLWSKALLFFKKKTPSSSWQPGWE